MDCFGNAASIARSHDGSKLFAIAKTSIVIEAPVGRVWAILDDLSLESLQAWNRNLEAIERPSGNLNHEGHRAITTRTGIGRIQLTTLSRVVDQHIVYHAEPLDGRSAGFGDFRVEAAGPGCTLVAHSSFTEHRDHDGKTDPAEIRDATLTSVNILLERLKAFAERGSAIPAKS